MSSYKFEEVCNFCYKLSSHKASPTYTFRNKASGGECPSESDLFVAKYITVSYTLVLYTSKLYAV